MTRKVALFISYFFQPLIIPSLIFLFLLHGVPQITSLGMIEKGILLLMVFLTTFLVPVLSIFTMRLTKNISSIHMSSREERLFPFSMVTLFYIISTYLFQIKFKIDPIFVQALGTITICLILLTAITFFWKISAHMTGISGLVGIIAVVIFKFQEYTLIYFLLAAILLTGSIGSARLYLNTHTPLEILAGAVLGFSICFGFFWFFL